MEIRDDRIHNPKLITRQDKQIRRTFKGSDNRIRLRCSTGRFQGAHACGSDCDYAPPRHFRLSDEIGYIWGELAPLSVDLMFLGILLMDRGEGVQSNMQNHRSEIHTLAFEFID